VTGQAAGSLRQHRDFRQLWAAQTITQLGSQMTLVALPLLAVAVLGASPFQMGVLTALQTVGFLVIGLPAGVWVDRWSLRRVLIASDVVRAVALLSVPAAYALDLLRLDQLFVVALVTGTATVFFEIAYQSYLPVLVDRGQVVEGNSKLETSRSAAEVAGPGGAGALVQLLGAPLLVGFDAVTFAVSAAFLGRIQRPENRPAPARARRSLLAEIRTGFRFVLGNRLLLRIVATTGISNAFSAVGVTLLVLYCVRELHLSASMVGFVVATGAVGGLVGAVSVGLISRRLGDSRSIPLAAAFLAPCGALVPLASVAGWPLVVVGMFGINFGVVVYNVLQVSFRQSICPPELLGRMIASIRFLVYGTTPLGALLAGVLASAFGIVPTLWVAAAGRLVAAVPVLFSPLLRTRDFRAEWEPGPHPAPPAA
jgi:MFS family permease